MKKSSLIFLFHALFTSYFVSGQNEFELNIEIIDSNWYYTNADSSINKLGILSITFSDSTQSENKLYFGYVGHDYYFGDILIERHRIFKNGFRYRARFNEDNGKLIFINSGSEHDRTSSIMEFYKSGQVASIKHYRIHDDPINDTLDGTSLEFDEEGTITSLRIYNDGVLLTK